MSKIQYDPSSPLAKFYAKTDVDGDIITYPDDRATYLLNKNTGSITVRLKWKYEWHKDNTVKDDWTVWEKAVFMRAVYLSVQQEWKNNLLCVRWISFCKKIPGESFTFRCESNTCLSE